MRTPRGAVTLVEILMSLAFLSLLLVTGLGVLHWALSGTQAQQTKMLAACLGQQKMEELCDASEPVAGSGRFAEPHQDFEWKAQVAPLDEGAYVQLDVTVKGPRGASYTLHTQRVAHRRAFLYRVGSRLLRSSEDRREDQVVREDVARSGFSVASGGHSIAWVQVRDGRPQIVTSALGGTDAPSLLFQHPTGASEPSYSPDGRRLAFSSLENGTAQVFVYDLERRSARKWSSGRHHDGAPSWTPDGKALLVCRNNSSIVLLQADGSERVLVPEEQAGWNACPDLSPDGKSLVFMSTRDGNPEIYRLDLSSRRVLRLTTNSGYDSQPRFSPDGKRILFTSRGQDGVTRVNSMNADGSHVTPLTDGATVDDPRWVLR